MKQKAICVLPFLSYLSIVIFHVSPYIVDETFYLSYYFHRCSPKSRISAGNL